MREEEPWQLPDGTWNWDYLPVPTKLCDFCASRAAAGLEPMCVQSCQAKVIEVGPVEEMMGRLGQLDGKAVVYRL